MLIVIGVRESAGCKQLGVVTFGDAAEVDEAAAAVHAWEHRGGAAPQTLGHFLGEIDRPALQWHARGASAAHSTVVGNDIGTKLGRETRSSFVEHSGISVNGRCDRGIASAERRLKCRECELVAPHRPRERVRREACDGLSLTEQ